MKIVATNRDINFKYEIIEDIECGIELKGTEVKSIRENKINLKDGFALIRKGEVILKNVHIAHYEQGNINNVDEKRNRRLLLHKEEINKLSIKINQSGYTLVPYKVGLSGRYVKVILALCKGKNLHDKRESIKEREAKRKIEQAIKNN
jgi:SsrA-binding protein